MAGSRSALNRSELRLVHLLRVFAFLFLGAAILYACGPFLDELGALVLWVPLLGASSAGQWGAASLTDASSIFVQLPLVAASVVKVSLLGWLCLYAAADVRHRHKLVALVIAAHVVSVSAMLLLLLTGRAASSASGDAVVGVFSSVPVATALWGAVGLDGVILIVLIVVYGMGEFEAPERSIYELDDHLPSTPGECNLKAFARVGGWGLIAAAAGVEWLAWAETWPTLMVELPFVTNTVVALATVGLVCLFVAREMRQRMSLMGLVVWAQAMGVGVLVMYWALGQDNGTTVDAGAIRLATSDLLLLSIAAAGVFGLLATVYYQIAWHTRYQLQYLQPMEFRTLLALSEILIVGSDQVLSPLQVAQNVDRDVNKIGARRRWIYRIVLFAVYIHPLLYFRAPLPEMASDIRSRHVRRHFHWETLTRPMNEWLRQQVQGAIRVAKQLVYVGYYNDPRTFDSVGYEPFSQRTPREGEGARTVSDTSLQVWDFAHPAIKHEERIGPFDICIIGSGAAGGILARELSRRHPAASIVILERGQYVPPSEFTENEVDMMGRLYADGLFQQTRDNRFTILQGSCVGGSTVVNNAVSFDPPGPVLDRWKAEFGADFGSELANSVADVRAYLKIQSQNHGYLNPSARPFLTHTGSAGVPLTAAPVDANIEGCLGCGYCNIGCAYGKKLSMLETALPDAQATRRVNIVAECEVDRIRTVSDDPLRVHSVLARLKGPDGQWRWITIEANTFVLAAGAIASSWLLMKSGLSRGRPVGQGMSFNLGSPITAEFPDKSRFTNGLPAYAGLQISHAAVPTSDRGWVAETWWNPPVAQAVNMPGWFEHHYANMKRYDRLMAIGLLVGTESEGRVARAITGGPDVKYEPNQSDLGKLAEALRTVSEILLDSGATRVMLNTAHPSGEGDVFSTSADLARMRDIVLRGSRYLTVGTGHPQGGNAISPDRRRGVVDLDFRVHGYGNLYVCDASVFPTSLTVNPQLTVMGLAHLAAQRISVS